MTEHETNAADEPKPNLRWPRRSVLAATGFGATLPGVGRAGAASGDSDSDGDEQRSGDDGGQPVVHPQFGYSGTSDDPIPEGLSPDETVELHVDEERIDDENLPELTVEFGAFHFEPVGIQVEPGALLEFDFASPEHSVTAYHPGQERQRRVPEGVPAFSSPVNADDGFWLYRFETEGVYDLFCAPHEWGGMGMRIVVGDAPGDVVRAQGRPPLPLTGALLGTGLPPDGPDVGHPKLEPQSIVDDGPVSTADLDIDLEVTLSGPSPS